ncbi:MAG: 3-oxoacyl-ACP reductase FabG [Desulfovibrionaceae bacterium]|nr:3-oxoacyl-ACP reductase FabG [Desulfovibrionaceae bacterium]
MSDIALITGAGRGIGRACALGLAEDGYDIWLNYRSSHREALEAAALIEKMGRRCLLLRFDVTDAEGVARVLQPRLSEETPAVLVNNAGYNRDGMFGLMSDDDWKNVLNVHLNGFFNVTRLLVPHMIHARRGRIVNISSVSGQAGNAGQVNYSAAKAGLIGATRALARELGKRGVLVNAVAPGIIDTDMAKGLPVEEMTKAVPLRRMGTADEVAGCVRFLCSKWATYVTGQVIAVNGGLYM